MGILSWIVVGFIAGWLAGQLVRGGGYGLIGDIIVGVIGGIVGGWLASTLFHMPDAVNGINAPSIAIAFIGAVIAVVVLRALSGNLSGARAR